MYWGNVSILKHHSRLAVHAQFVERLLEPFKSACMWSKGFSPGDATMMYTLVTSNSTVTFCVQLSHIDSSRVFHDILLLDSLDMSFELRSFMAMPM
jgi:hypothetical protein